MSRLRTGVDTKGDTWTAQGAPGVYVITCVPVDRKYVGSSKNVRNRLKQHKALLESGKHDNKGLQRAWKKYRPEQFTVVVVEYCAEHSLIERENYYITLNNSYSSGYNQTPTAEPLAHKTKGHLEKLKRAMVLRNKTTKQSAEQRAASGARLTHVNKTLVHTEERRRKASERAKLMHAKGLLRPPQLRGINIYTPELGAKISASMRKRKGGTDAAAS